VIFMQNFGPHKLQKWAGFLRFLRRRFVVERARAVSEAEPGLNQSRRQKFEASRRARELAMGRLGC
jgi:hypothetical protein